MGRRKDIKKLTDAKVVALAKEDSYYFGELYDRYFDQIFRFVFKRLGGDEAVAGDVTQQTFMKAMANLDKYEDRGFRFSSWLYRIAQNEVNMYFRKSKKEASVPVDENRLKDVATEANIERYMSENEQQLLIDILNEIDEEDKDLIEIRFFQELSFKEIAVIYNISEANAKMRTYRILEKIGKKWSK